MNMYPTPHINATPQDFAKTVLMPGDPLRSKFIAENFLENAKLINNVRKVSHLISVDSIIETRVDFVNSHLNGEILKFFLKFIFNHISLF